MPSRFYIIAKNKSFQINIFYQKSWKAIVSTTVKMHSKWIANKTTNLFILLRLSQTKILCEIYSYCLIQKYIFNFHIFVSEYIEYNQKIILVKIFEIMSRNITSHISLLLAAFFPRHSLHKIRRKQNLICCVDREW